MSLSIKILYGFVILLICIDVIRADDDDCELPDLDDVDWTKLEGSWYDFLNTGSPTDKMVPCFDIKDLKSTVNGFEFKYKDDAKMIDVTIKMNKQESGTYLFDNAQRQAVTDFFVTRENSSENRTEDLKEELETYFDLEAVYFTDYDNYLMSLRCSKKGEVLFWIVSRDPKPSVKTAVESFNKLIDLGEDWSSVRLALSTCAKPKPKKQVQPEFSK
ncbi:uncharacterized protein LOC144432412 [Styela clava]